MCGRRQPPSNPDYTPGQTSCSDVSDEEGHSRRDRGVGFDLFCMLSCVLINERSVLVELRYFRAFVLAGASVFAEDGAFLQAFHGTFRIFLRREDSSAQLLEKVTGNRYKPQSLYSHLIECRWRFVNVFKIFLSNALSLSLWKQWGLSYSDRDMALFSPECFIRVHSGGSFTVFHHYNYSKCVI